MAKPFGVGAGRLRSILMVSTAATGVAVGTPVFAQDTGITGRPQSVAPEDYGEAMSAPLDRVSPEPYSPGVEATAPSPDIVIADPNTPTTALDPGGVNGIGQMIIDQKNGFIGLCTGTLINPRTVIFAAHCVNERAANAYGAASGGQPIAFGFSSNNNQSGNSAFGNWLNGTAANKYKTSIARNLYNVNYVVYNPGSVEPNSGGAPGTGAGGFLQSDIALATLDTPAANVPTWALLFSALPSTTIIAATGSGYHVTIDGYGRNGTATTGSTGGIDFRRRIAENIVGGLASLDQFENFMFGGAATANPQNLYWIDFDDPRRGTATPPSVFDFNAWRDNAVASGKEGITASGDSGGPLILDQAYATKLVIGVLSGGYTQIFANQPPNGYGTASFFQPLYLYWDYIAANNPYHYVGSLAGNANWNDPTHWVSMLDPNYYVISGSTVVNGVPTTPGEGKTGNTGTWGQACFQSGDVSDCLDMKTGVETIEAKPIGTGGTGDVTNAMAVVTADLATGDSGGDAPAGVASAQQKIAPVSAEAQGVQVAQALPTATLANGLPGATNFVPNNFNGDRLTSTAPRYFDVTLGATGTTTLSSTAVVDRFKITGGGAMLDITSAGSLTSLMDINQITGTMQVNGLLTSVGDYLMVAGGLNGTGTITAPFFTSAAGTISPGTTGAAGTIGTLTFKGNTVFASGNTLLIDLGNGSASDLVQVQTGAAGSGIANIGGRVLFSVAAGSTPRAGNVYQILTAQNSVTGTFLAGSTLSAILAPQISYTANAVNVTLVPGSYVSVLGTGATPVQLAYAYLLDRNRAAAGANGLSSMYDTLDLASVGTIQSTLEALAPRTETLRTSLAMVSSENIDRVYHDRLANMQPGALGGAVAYIGRPLQSVARASMPIVPGTSSGFDGSDDTRVAEGRLPETMSGFLAGGYLNGDSAPMTTALPAGGRDTFDGWYLASGIEVEVGDAGVVGFGLSYTDLKGQTTIASQSARSKLYAGSLYMKAKLGGPFVIDAVSTAGLLSTRTQRSATIGAATYQLNADDDALVMSSEIGIGAMYGQSIQFGPRIAARVSHIGFSRTLESGGPPALVMEREAARSIQGRAGLELRGTSGKIRPFGSATYVHDFEDRPAIFGANFAGGVGPYAGFALTGTDHDWFEVGGGLTFSAKNVEFSLSANTTIDRQDVSAQSYRGSITFHF